nr:MAG TPA: hypothetical protein [Caudoviricetes sp.]
MLTVYLFYSSSGSKMVAEKDSPTLPSGSFWLRLANRKTL